MIIRPYLVADSQFTWGLEYVDPDLMGKMIENNANPQTYYLCTSDRYPGKIAFRVIGTENNYLVNVNNDDGWLESAAVDADFTNATFNMKLDHWYTGYAAFTMGSPSSDAYIRHWAYKLKLNPDDSSTIFKEDSSFSVQYVY